LQLELRFITHRVSQRFLLGVERERNGKGIGGKRGKSKGGKETKEKHVRVTLEMTRFYVQSCRHITVTPDLIISNPTGVGAEFQVHQQ